MSTRKAFQIGCISGGILGLFIALSMDFLLGGAVGSSWRDAVAHDLGLLFGGTFGRNSLVVIAGVVLVIGFIGAFGAIVGGIFAALITKLLTYLTGGE